MVAKFVLMKNEPYVVDVPVHLHVNDGTVDEVIMLKFNRVGYKDLDSVDGFTLADKVVHSVVSCFPIVGVDGEELPVEEVRTFLIDDPAIQNAIISRWREVQSKKNQRLT